MKMHQENNVGIYILLRKKVFNIYNLVLKHETNIEIYIKSDVIKRQEAISYTDLQLKNRSKFKCKIALKGLKI